MKPIQVSGNPYFREGIVRATNKALAKRMSRSLSELESEGQFEALKGNKYHAERTWSELCQRTFASKAEARRGEELALLQKAGEIEALVYQPKFVLSEKPRVTYYADFQYQEKSGKEVVEDVKGKDTSTSRVKRAWVKQLLGIAVVLVKSE